MHTQLQQDLQHLNHLLDEVKALARQHYDKIEQIAPGRYVENIKHQNLSQNGIGTEATLAYFKENIASKIANSTGPNYFGFVTGGSTPAAVIGDQLVSIYDQNAFGSNDSMAPQIEHETIHMLKQIFGLVDDFHGSFVTGATMSNFVSLAVARQWAGEQQHIDVSAEGTGKLKLKIASATAHSSLIKSLSMLGIGRNNWTRIDSLPDREAIDCLQLEKFLDEHKHLTTIVVANAGTVNTGDFDDLEKISALKEKYNFWLHIDAAFGGFAALSEKHQHLLKGINKADSITIDAHKWLNVPYDSAMQFNKHKKLLGKVFQNSAAYLSDASMSPDFFHYGPENSRRWRALPAWFTLMAYGKEGHAEIVKRNCEAAKHMATLIEASEHFKLLAPVQLNIVCFTINHAATSNKMVTDFLAMIRDDGRAFFTPTVYQGKAAIRAAVSNWMTHKDHVEKAFHALEDVYKKMSKSMS